MLSADSPAEILEKPSCPLCGNYRAKVVYRWPQTVYQVLRCVACRFFFLSPRPAQAALLARYGDDGYFGNPDGDSGYQDYSSQRESLSLTFRRLLKHLEGRGLTGGALLEIGCGFGYLLAAAKPLFQSIEATDFSAAALEQARPFADRLYQGGAAALPAQKRFDLIIANHVVEHVHEPGPFVRQLADLLAPGGTLLLSTPDMGSFWRRLMGRRWPSFKLPEHLLYFDRNSLTELMKSADLVNVESVPYPHAFPLKLAAAKLGLRLPRALGNRVIWIPKTTLALRARKAL